MAAQPDLPGSLQELIVGEREYIGCGPSADEQAVLGKDHDLVGRRAGALELCEPEPVHPDATDPLREVRVQEDGPAGFRTGHRPADHGRPRRRLDRARGINRQILQYRRGRNIYGELEVPAWA